MSDSQNNLTIVLNQQDEDGTNILNRTLGAFTYAGDVGTFFRGTLVGTGAVSFTLPATNALQAMVINRHATALITIVGTVQGGASQTITRLSPGGMWANWMTASGATVGYTALSLQSDTTGADYEAYLGG